MINKDLKNNTLVIPKELHTHDKVEQLFKYNNDATILYKSFDLNNLVFYTQTYCIVYNCSGVETITSYDFKEVIIRENELLFLPKDMYLISDFIKTDKSLEAFLFFFNDDIIEKFLSIKKLKKNLVDKKVSFFKMEVNSSVFEYMKALRQVSKNQFNSKHFLELKLLELLEESYAQLASQHGLDPLKIKGLKNYGYFPECKLLLMGIGANVVVEIKGVKLIVPSDKIIIGKGNKATNNDDKPREADHAPDRFLTLTSLQGLVPD